jgi:hypothetical protein
LANPFLINGHKGVGWEEFLLNVEGQKFTCIITRQSIGGLGQIIGAEGEESAVKAARGNSIMVPIR